jgi:hypothetical protein
MAMAPMLGLLKAAEQFDEQSDGSQRVVVGHPDRVGEHGDRT